MPVIYIPAGDQYGVECVNSQDKDCDLVGHVTKKFSCITQSSYVNIFVCTLM